VGHLVKQKLAQQFGQLVPVLGRLEALRRLAKKTCLSKSYWGPGPGAAERSKIQAIELAG